MRDRRIPPALIPIAAFLAAAIVVFAATQTNRGPYI